MQDVCRKCATTNVLVGSLAWKDVFVHLFIDLYLS